MDERQIAEKQALQLKQQKRYTALLQEFGKALQENQAVERDIDQLE